MRRGRTFLIALLLAVTARAERTTGFFQPAESFAVEVSLDNSPYLRLPIYRSAITSLEVGGDHAIGGTTASEGSSPFLFAVSLSQRRLVSILDVERVVPGQVAVVSGFGRGREGLLFAGTLARQDGDSGHLLQVTVNNAGGVQATDLGAPVPGEGVFALTADAARGMLYGLSYPTGKFFARSLADGQVRTFDSTSPDKRERAAYSQLALRPRDYLSRRLVVDRDGRVYGSQPSSRLFRYDPRTGTLEVLTARLPAEWDRSALGRIDAWAVAADGALYGGNAGGGEIFRLDPATGALTNLGKAISTPRVKGLAFAADGRLYGIGGATPGYSHLFSYDAREGFADLGNPCFPMVGEGLAPGIFWRGFQLESLAVSEDGRYVVMGDDEALSQLMVFKVAPR